MVTDFNTWSDAEIKWFLDLRGEDYDEHDHRPQLVRACVRACGRSPPKPAGLPTGVHTSENDPCEGPWFVGCLRRGVRGESAN